MSSQGSARRQGPKAPYDAFADVYDLEYWDRKEDLPLYRWAANTFGSPVLEIGTGTGRVAFDLASAGHTVVGIDNSVEMLREFRRKRARLPDQQQSRVLALAADVRAFHLRKQFPLCVAPFRAFAHLLTVEDQLRALNAIREHLAPDGVFVFDTFEPLPQWLAHTHLRDEEEREDPASGEVVKIVTRVSFDPARQLVHFRSRYLRRDSSGRWRGKLRRMTMRYTYRYELEHLLWRAGFEPLEWYGWFDRSPYTATTGILVGVARRK